MKNYTVIMKKEIAESFKISFKKVYNEQVSVRIDDLEKVLHKKLIERIMNLKCDECDGSGSYSSPSNYGPCNYCDGSGFNQHDGCFNDVFNDLIKK